MRKASTRAQTWALGELTLAYSGAGKWDPMGGSLETQELRKAIMSVKTSSSSTSDIQEDKQIYQDMSMAKQ